MVLPMYDVGTHTIWDIVTGEYTSTVITKADPGAVGNSAATSSVTEQEWTKENYPHYKEKLGTQCTLQDRHY